MKEAFWALLLDNLCKMIHIFLKKDVTEELENAIKETFQAIETAITIEKEPLSTKLINETTPAIIISFNRSLIKELDLTVTYLKMLLSTIYKNIKKLLFDRNIYESTQLRFSLEKNKTIAFEISGNLSIVEINEAITKLFEFLKNQNNEQNKNLPDSLVLKYGKKARQWI